MKSSRQNKFDLFRYIRIPRFLEMPAIGIDISDSCIRYVELQKRGDQFLPYRYGEKKLAPGVVVSGSVIKKDELIKTLSEVAKEEKYKCVKASLPEDKAYVFTVSLPKIPEADIPEAISFRIEDNAPISPKDAIFDYTIIGKNEKDEIDVSVTVIQESVINEYIEIYNKAGLMPRSFELESHAIARALVRRDDPKTYMIVHIGENRTVFSIVRFGVLRYTSTLHVGGGSITNAISRNLSVDEKTAEDMKKQLDGDFSNNNKVFESMLGALSSIKDEINKLSVYWFTHKPTGTPGIQKIDEILISGKDATTSGVLEYISRNSKTPVKIANAWETCFSSDEIIPNIPLSESLNYVISIGLSLPKKTNA